MPSSGIFQKTFGPVASRLSSFNAYRGPARWTKILYARKRAAIQNGKLPSREPTRTWGGPGVGARCAICDLPVRKTEMEFEIQFARDDDNPGLDKFHVHLQCFAAWEFERGNEVPPA